MALGDVVISGVNRDGGDGDVYDVACDDDGAHACVSFAAIHNYFLTNHPNRRHWNQIQKVLKPGVIFS